MVASPNIVIVEPYLAGTSASAVAQAVVDLSHRLLAIGVPNTEHRNYGSRLEHDAAHGLDPACIRRLIDSFLVRRSIQPPTPSPPTSFVMAR